MPNPEPPDLSEPIAIIEGCISIMEAATEETPDPRLHTLIAALRQASAQLTEIDEAL